MHVNHRYRLLRSLGTGSAGRVYVARDALYGDSTVAMKLIDVSAQKGEQAPDLRREFFALRAIDHPNIVRVFDFGKVVDAEPVSLVGNVFFTMEYVDGRGLLDAIKEAEWDFVYEVVYQIAHALGTMHRRGLVHFDVKPENMLVTEGLLGDELVQMPKLVDFGFAMTKLESSERPLRGTPAYLAPELIRGEAYDHRVDLYSFGVVLFQLVSGRLPFQADTPVDLLKSHLSETPPSLQSIKQGVPEDISDLIAGLLEKDPGRRIQDAWEVIRRVGGKFERFPSIQLYLSSMRPGQFVGRKAELSTLRSNVAQRMISKVDEKGVQSLFVFGDSGIGKTSILDELKRHLQVDDFLVFEARCYSRNCPAFEPLKPFLRSLKFVLRTLGEDGEHILQQFSARLEPILKEESTKREEDHRETGADLARVKLRRIEDVVQFLLCTSGVRGFVLLVDDVHLADDPTRELLEYLLRGASRFSVALVITAESKQNISSLVEAAGARGAMIRCRELNVEDVENLLRWALALEKGSHALAWRIVEEIGGSPSMLRDFLQQFHVFSGEAAAESIEGVLSDIAHQKHVPQSIVPSYVLRLERTSPDELSTLRLLSYFRSPVSFSVLARLSPIPSQRLSQLLARLDQKGYVRGLDNRTAFSFRHLHFQNFVSESISEGKKEVNRKIAQLLEDVHRSETDRYADEIAYHYEQGGDAVKAYRFYRRAAERALADCALNRTVELLEHAHRIASSGQVEVEPSLVGELADAYRLAGDLGRAEQLFRQLVGRGAVTASDRQRYLMALGSIKVQEGIYDEASDFLEQAKSVAASDEERVSVEQELIAIEISRGRYVEARTHCRRLLSEFSGVINAIELIRLHNRLGIISFYENRFEEASQDFSDAVHLSEQWGEKRGGISAHLNLGNVLSRQGSHQRAEEHWNRALALSKEMGDIQQEAHVYNNLGISAYTDGRYKDAMEHYTHALDILTRLGSLSGMALCHGNMGEVCLARCEYEDALRQWRLSLDLYARTGDQQGLAEAHNLFGHLYILLGETAKAREHCEAAHQIIVRKGIESQRGLQYFVEGSLEFAEGNVTRAADPLGKAKEFFSRTNNQRMLAVVLLKLSELQARGGQWEAVDGTLREALQNADAVMDRRLKAEVLLTYGRYVPHLQSLEEAHPLSYFRKSHELLRGEEICETTWKVCSHLGKEYARRGLSRKALEYLLQAEHVLQHIASRIKNPGLTSAYLLSPDRRETLTQIKKLREELGR